LKYNIFFDPFVEHGEPRMRAVFFEENTNNVKEIIETGPVPYPGAYLCRWFMRITDADSSDIILHPFYNDMISDETDCIFMKANDICEQIIDSLITECGQEEFDSF
jgi:hypothetical protein